MRKLPKENKILIDLLDLFQKYISNRVKFFWVFRQLAYKFSPAIFRLHLKVKAEITTFLLILYSFYMAIVASYTVMYNTVLLTIM